MEIKWFGDSEPHGFTSRYDSWRYLEEQGGLPVTRGVLATLCDLRVPLTFEEDDCRLIVEVVDEVLREQRILQAGDLAGAGASG